MSHPVLPAGSIADQPQDDARYLALKARDSRFDGHFFTGVTSTGIYCRPVCKVRTPKRENCRFFVLAAQAEAAGFRPCLRCRPEMAPGAGHDWGAVAAAWSTQNATGVLALQAAHALQNMARSGDSGTGAGACDRLTELARHMGVSDRHLRRIFALHWGISPLQYLQTHRLLNAKQLLTDTRLPVTQIAALSGFGSLRRFNAAFVQHYRLQPLALRRAAGSTRGNHKAGDGNITLKLGYRAPYQVDAMLNFLQQRAIAGMEEVDPVSRTWQRSLALPCLGTLQYGWFKAQFDSDAPLVVLQLSESLAPVLPGVLARVRAALDLDADLPAIDACLLPDFPGTAGMRLPGTVDGFELAVRAVLGQQISVAAARTLACRLVQALGTRVARADGQAALYFPTAQQLAAASAAMLGEMGIVRQRQTALLELARRVGDGRLDLQPTPHPEPVVQELLSIPGIGPWTAQYISMRALRWPDAFPSGDVALQNALHVRQKSHPPRPAAAAKAAEAASVRWTPWRSYAVIRAWHSLSNPASAPLPGHKPTVTSEGFPENTT